MEYIITFLEGIITFISPCLLPMLPLFIVYFAGDSDSSGSNLKKTLLHVSGFILGFTALFVILGAFAGTLGSLLLEYRLAVNLITGGIIVLFGLNYTGILKIAFLNQTKKTENKIRPTNFFSSFLFGVVFSIGWTPCVGAFLGSALMMAAQSGTVVKGILMLLFYSLGLGIPFLLSAVLIDKLRGAFGFIKQHYRVINIVCGILLIVIGILMMTGFWSVMLSWLS